MALQNPNPPMWIPPVGKCLETSTTRLGWGTFALPWVDSLARQSAISVELALHCSPEGGGELTQQIGRWLTHHGVVDFQSKWGSLVSTWIQPFYFKFFIMPGCAIDERDGALWSVVPSLATEVRHWSTVDKTGLWSMLDIDKWCIYCRVTLLPFLICNNWSTFLCYDQVCSGEVSRCLWGCRETCRGDTKQ